MLTEIEIAAMSDEERARHLAEFDARLTASTAQTRHENLRLEEKLARLEALAEAQEKIADEMERLVEQSGRIRAEKEALMAA